ARWRAARYGLSEDLVVATEARSAPAADVVRALLAVVRPALEDWGELERVTGLVAQVLARGTSAQRQRQLVERGATLTDVVDWLVAETAGAPNTSSNVISSHRTNVQETNLDQGR
ncbi:MAG: hypothetical protein ABW219_12870, partial [Ilumatobacteraceae bacterium]